MMIKVYLSPTFTMAKVVATYIAYHANVLMQFDVNASNQIIRSCPILPSKVPKETLRMAKERKALKRFQVLMWSKNTRRHRYPTIRIQSA